MRLSLTGSLSFEGRWIEDSEEPLKTSISYRLLNYGQLITYRNQNLGLEDVISNIICINNCIIRDEQFKTVTDSDQIEFFLGNMESNQFNSLLEEMLRDSFLTIEEYRRLEFIVYYLNWKADETSRRTSYNCDECRKFDFIKSRYCYLETTTADLPQLSIGIDEVTGAKSIQEDDSKPTTEEEFLNMLNELSSINRELSIFEISLKYFGKMHDDKIGNVELCPEAIKIHAENLAEMFEMEARCSEYSLFPFGGGQVDQPAILIEAFDAIRTGRNTFGSKKAQELRSKNKNE
jgi:hypothetical protein